MGKLWRVMTRRGASGNVEEVCNCTSEVGAIEMKAAFERELQIKGEQFAGTSQGARLDQGYWIEPPRVPFVAGEKLRAGDCVRYDEQGIVTRVSS